MTDSIKLPLRTRKTVSGIRIYCQFGTVVADVWAEFYEDQEALEHRADLIVAALTADAEKPSFEDCNYQHRYSPCGNCGWEPNAEKGTVCPGCIDCGPPIAVRAEQRCGEKEEQGG